MSTEYFAKIELSTLDLGDSRHNKRLIKIITDKIKSPNTSYLESIDGDEGAVKAYYRLIEFLSEKIKKDEYKNSIIAPHYFQVERRAKAEDIIIYPCDSTRLNYSEMIKCEGMGIISSNKKESTTLGVLLYYTLACRIDGTPLGIVARDCLSLPKRKKGEKVANEDKKSYYWFKEARSVMELAKRIPDKTHIFSTDREGDILALYVNIQACQNLYYVIRAKNNRADSDGNLIFDSVKNSDCLGEKEIVVPRKSERKNKSGRKSRKAILRFYSISYKINLSRKAQAKLNQKYLKQYIVYIIEKDKPDDDELICWFINTNLEVITLEDALFVLKIYNTRWKIEEYNKVLKSGCKIEQILNHDINRLRVVVDIIFIVAGRLVMLNMIARNEADIPIEEYFDETECTVLGILADECNKDKPITIGDAIKLISKQGGYLGRKGDNMPGNQVFLKGFKKFQDKCAIVRSINSKLHKVSNIDLIKLIQNTLN